MDTCPRCGADLETFALWGREEQTCPDCSYVGVPVEHASDRESPESWGEALERFYEEHGVRGGPDPVEDGASDAEGATVDDGPDGGEGESGDGGRDATGGEDADGSDSGRAADGGTTPAGRRKRRRKRTRER